MDSPEISRVTSADGTSIAYERVGSGPSLVLVDAAGNFRGFSPMPALAAALSEHFSVYTYDRRGKGASGDTLPYAVDREIDDLSALIDRAGGSAFVHGFSSGAVLTLIAAERGIGIARVSLLEPALSLEEKTATGRDLGAEVAKLVVTGHRADAYELWMKNIGVPAEMIAEMRHGPLWPALEATAHTLVYDSLINLRGAQLAAITTPALVVASDASGQLLDWAKGVTERLPNGSLSILKGMWHGVAPEVLAPVLTRFFIDR